MVILRDDCENWPRDVKGCWTGGGKKTDWRATQTSSVTLPPCRHHNPQGRLFMVDIATLEIRVPVSVPKRSTRETCRRQLSAEVSWGIGSLAPSRLSSNLAWQTRPRECVIYWIYWYTPLSYTVLNTHRVRSALTGRPRVESTKASTIIYLTPPSFVHSAWRPSGKTAVWIYCCIVLYLVQRAIQSSHPPFKRKGEFRQKYSTAPLPFPGRFRAQFTRKLTESIFVRPQKLLEIWLKYLALYSSSARTSIIEGKNRSTYYSYVIRIESYQIVRNTSAANYTDWMVGFTCGSCVTYVLRTYIYIFHKIRTWIPRTQEGIICMIHTSTSGSFFFSFIKSWKTSAVSTTVWMVSFFLSIINNQNNQSAVLRSRISSKRIFQSCLPCMIYASIL